MVPEKVCETDFVHFWDGTTRRLLAERRDLEGTYICISECRYGGAFDVSSY